MSKNQAKGCSGKCGSGKHFGGCRYICPHNNLLALHPELCLEWDHDRNNHPPSEYTPGTRIKVWWICAKNSCGCHRWQATINGRVASATGCPFCWGSKLCSHNNLLALYPDLCLEWDYDRNEFGPDMYPPGSNKFAFWICQKNSCGCHRWKTQIIVRTKGHGCPYCYVKPCAHNNLLALYPDICLEWNQKNVGLPETYAPHSNSKIWWRCLEKGHEWLSSIGSRVNGRGCPHCAKTRMYSKKQIIWLENIMKEQKISIQHALSPEGEYRIPTIGKVDGYCASTNTVFEFHGDYWHGNPLVWDENKVHEVIGKLFGQLYRETLARDDKIRKLGYNLVVQWETNLE